MRIPTIAPTQSEGRGPGNPKEGAQSFRVKRATESVVYVLRLGAAGLLRAVAGVLRSLGGQGPAWRENKAPRGCECALDVLDAHIH